MQRRTVLQGLAAASVATALAGCALWRRPIKPICDDRTGSAASGFTIDVHSHMFNGSDLPVARYVELVAARETGLFRELVDVFGEVLQFVTWGIAPDAAAERRTLRALAAGGGLACPRNALSGLTAGARQVAYSVGANELKRAANVRRSALRSANVRIAPDTGEGAALAAIDSLPANEVEFRVGLRASAGNPALVRKTPASLLAFVLEMFQYRYTSFADYVSEFEATSNRHMDLTVAALVDYDWWLAAGRPTKTSLADQVSLAGDLAVATNGRLHPWAPFCPYREAQHRFSPSSTSSSLALVKDAVLNHGAIGVKIYPPMGFAPLGNAALGSDLWRSADWLSGLAHQDGFGTRLDAALTDLYTWCVAEDVPILAHANRSSGPSPAFDALAGPDHWRFALEAFPGLRVIFGHFGGADSDRAFDTAAEFIHRMSRTAGEPGTRAFADVSYFARALEQPDGLEKALLRLFSHEGDPRSILPGRLLFGSDWKMLLIEADAGRYVDRVQAVVTALEKTPPPIGPLIGLVTGVFASNAVECLGLRRGQRVRNRLDAFYKARSVSPPSWSAIVDAMP